MTFEHIFARPRLLGLFCSFSVTSASYPLEGSRRPLTSSPRPLQKPSKIPHIFEECREWTCDLVRASTRTLKSSRKNREKPQKVPPWRGVKSEQILTFSRTSRKSAQREISEKVTPPPPKSTKCHLCAPFSYSYLGLATF